MVLLLVCVGLLAWRHRRARERDSGRELSQAASLSRLMEDNETKERST
jgi:hypothetical protein